MMSNENVKQDEVTEISLSEIFSSIKHHLIMIFLIVVLCTGAGVLYLKFAVPQYEASATIMVKPLESSSSITSLLDMTSSSSSKISTEVELLTSRQSFQKALDSLDLSQYVNDEGVRYSDLEFPLTPQSLKEKVQVVNVRDTNLVTITTTDQNPQFARDFTNALAASFSSMMVDIAKNSSKTKLDFVESQIPINEAELSVALDELAAFQIESGVLNMTKEAEVALKMTTYLAQRTESLRLEILDAESQFAALAPGFDNSVIDISSHFNALSNIYKEILTFDSTAVMLDSTDIISQAQSERYYSLNQQILNAKTELSQAVREQLISHGLDGQTAVLYANYYIQKSFASLLSDEIEQERGKYEEIIDALPLVQKEQGVLTRKVEVLQAASVKLAQMLEEVKMLDASVISNVTNIDDAILPLKPVSPKKLRILALSFLAGCVLGLGIAILVELNIHTIESVDEMKQCIGDSTSFLGWIPMIAKKRKNRYFGCVVTHEPMAFEAERYKLIASNIIYGDLLKGKCITISSASKNVGKTSAMCNIAASLAISGNKVLLLDGDVRLPSCEAFFGYSRSEKGFVDSLLDGEDFHQFLIQPSEDLPTLHLLPAGNSHRISSFAFKSQLFQQLLDDIQDEYDYVLIDAPPLIYGSELLAIAKCAKDVVIIARAGIDTTKEIRELIDSFKSIDANVVGVVLNGYITNKFGNKGRYGYYTYDDKSKEAMKAMARSYFISRRHYYRSRYKRDLYFRKNDKKTVLKPATPLYAQEKTKEVKEEAVINTVPDNFDFLSDLQNDSNASGKKS